MGVLIATVVLGEIGVENSSCCMRVESCNDVYLEFQVVVLSEEGRGWQYQALVKECIKHRFHACFFLFLSDANKCKLHIPVFLGAQ